MLTAHSMAGCVLGATANKEGHGLFTVLSHDLMDEIRDDIVVGIAGELADEFRG